MSHAAQMLTIAVFVYVAMLLFIRYSHNAARPGF